MLSVQCSAAVINRSQWRYIGEDQLSKLEYYTLQYTKIPHRTSCSFSSLPPLLFSTLLFFSSVPLL